MDAALDLLLPSSLGSKVSRCLRLLQKRSGLIGIRLSGLAEIARELPTDYIRGVPAQKGFDVVDALFGQSTEGGIRMHTAVWR